MKKLRIPLVYLRGVVLASLAAAPLMHAATIWNGPTINVSDATDPDHITTNVWLTRGVPPFTRVLLEEPRLQIKSPELGDTGTYQI